MRNHNKTLNLGCQGDSNNQRFLENVMYNFPDRKTSFMHDVERDINNRHSNSDT